MKASKKILTMHAHKRARQRENNKTMKLIAKIFPERKTTRRAKIQFMFEMRKQQCKQIARIQITRKAGKKEAICRNALN